MEHPHPVYRATLLLVGLSAWTTPDAVDAQSAAAVVDDYVAAFNAHDAEARVALLAHDVVIYDQHRDSVAVVAQGREAAARWLSETWRWFDEYAGSVEVVDQIVSDNLVVHRQRFTLRFDDGDENTWVEPAIYRVFNGKIYRIWNFGSEFMDPEKVPEVADAAFSLGEGPVVWIDEAHNNMHGAEGTYWAISEMLRRDGYRVYSWTRLFADSLPGSNDVLVISNALAERNLGEWSLPTPSAFTRTEIDRLAAWVRAGGGLLLIADHMPFPGATSDLAAAFGFEFSNGFAVDTAAADPSPTFDPYPGDSYFTFRREDGSLAPHPIREGRIDSANVDSVTTYTGQAFRAPEAAAPLYRLPATTISLLPDTAWRFSASTEIEVADEWLQGAALEFGQGRIVVFGEAAQFRAEVAGLDGDNGRYVRNVIAWLAGLLD